jgi:hypothetical protein
MTDGQTSQEEIDLTSQAEQQPVGLIREFWDFLKHNKKWWLTPIILVLLLFGALLILGGTAAAPFIYTLF